MPAETRAGLFVVAAIVGACAGDRTAPSAVPHAESTPLEAASLDAGSPEDAEAASNAREAEAAPSTGDTLPAGDPARVRQLFAVEVTTATDAVTGARVPVLLAEGVLSAPAEGMYVLLDTEGRIGDARVQTDRTRGWDRSASTPPLHLELQWAAPPSRDARGALHVVAVGPLDGTLPRARLLPVGIARAGLPAASPDESGHVHGPRGPATLAVDLDGDGEADLVRYQDRGALRSAPPHTLAWDLRGETWLRAAPSTPWQKVESCTWLDRTTVGP